jgi:LysR family transcriptional regulator for metE and metH
MAGMLPRLNLNHLAVLDALAETGTLTAAATRLGVTQSAVSHRLREAERRLGARLTRRAPGGRVTLTPEGDQLRDFAARTLGELARLEREIEARQSGDRRLVRLGQATYSRWHWLPDFLAYLAERTPELTVDLSGEATVRPFTSLAEGAVDVVTVYGRPAAMPRLRWFRLGSDPLVVAMAPAHRLAAHRIVDSRVIGDDRLFTYPISAEPGFEWEALLGRPNAPLRNVRAMPTPEAAIDLIRAGFGVGLFSRWAVEPEVADGTLVTRATSEEEFALDWWTVMRDSDAEDSPAGRLAQGLLAWSARHRNPLRTLGFDTGEEPRKGR